MQSPTTLNNQQAWGGQHFHHNRSTREENESEHTFVLRKRQKPRPHLLIPPGFVASESDDLFYPVSGGLSYYVFNLPPVPPRHHAYTRTTDMLVHQKTPRRPISTSYNNPSFAIPRTPVPLHEQNFRRSLGPPPPIPYQTHPNLIHYPPPAQVPAKPTPHSCHSHCNSHTLPTISKTLPSVTHIPLLTSKLDFFAWEEGVTTLLCANGLLGHILDPSESMDPSRPDCVASPPPTLPYRPSPEEIGNFNLWWDRENIVQHILVSCLGSLPCGLLPSPNIATRTALSIYKMLSQYFGTCSFADCAELLNSLRLHTLSCTMGHVLEYVTKWRTGISCLQSARFIFTVKLCLSFFVRGLLLISAFTTLRDCHG